MKLRSLTTLDKRNKITSRKFDDEVMLTNRHVIFIFPIYDQTEAIQKPNSGCVA